MKILYFIIVLVVGLWLFDKACLWLEHKGWLYYRFEKPQKGNIGSALLELNAQIMPSNRHVIVAQKQEGQSQKNIAGSGRS